MARKPGLRASEFVVERSDPYYFRMHDETRNNGRGDDRHMVAIGSIDNGACGSTVAVPCYSLCDIGLYMVQHDV